MESGAQKLSVCFNAVGQDTAAFEYGWCVTDHKDGRAIRKEYRKHDYMNDEPYASRVRAMLAQLGVPWPTPEEVYRGTHHDMLFLNSHGVVLRIGPTDVQDLVNPAIVQPLGWLEDKDLRITNPSYGNFETAQGVPLAITVYPGIELYSDDVLAVEGEAAKRADVRRFLNLSGQGTGDTTSVTNLGFIRVLDDEDKEVIVPMLLDADNDQNTSTPGLSYKRFQRMLALGKLLDNKGDVLSQTIDDVFSPQDIKLWKRAFEAHQPLRLLFWEAFKSASSKEQPDVAARANFWKACATVTNNPQSSMMPVWKCVVDADGKESFVRDEIIVPQIVLHRPWTGNGADNDGGGILFNAEARQRIAEAYHAALKTTDAGDLAAVFVDPQVDHRPKNQVKTEDKPAL